MLSARTARSARTVRTTGLALAALTTLTTLSTLAAVTAPGTGAAAAATAAGGAPAGPSFVRTATYPVFENRPAGEDPATATAAEISAVSADGRTVVYTDALAHRLGFLDISDPRRPAGRGTLAMSALGDADDEPTSVAVVGGYALAVVDSSTSFVEPSGRLDVIRFADRTRVRSLPLGGQPDSIAVSADHRYAVVAIENERDEDAVPAGRPDADEGDLPQPPAGYVVIVNLTGRDPAGWTTRQVPLTAADGRPLPALTAAGLAEPGDPEPEYVSVNRRNQAAVTLQENNGLVVIDLPTGRLVRAFSAGTSTVTGVDTEDDGQIALTGTVPDAPREPDAVGWVDDRYLATANEGDWRGGTRGWTVFDSQRGTVVWDSGNSLERLAARVGLHNEGRADNKGTEPEGLAVARYGNTTYAFVGSERSNFVAVYELGSPRRPELRQVLPATNGPEGLLPVPARDLLVASSEADDAAVLVRSSVGLYRLGAGQPRQPAFPGLVSVDAGAGDAAAPIGWGALSGLSPVPGRPHLLTAVTDAAYTPTRLLTVDTRYRPARIVAELTVRDGAGAPVGYDAEGVFARPQGGFWLAVEGTSGPANQVVRLDAAGVTREVLTLPAEIAAAMPRQGLEGVTATTGPDGREQVWVALQRELSTDPAGTVRLGRYDVGTGGWAWFGYRLETTSVPGDWIGLSEVTDLGRGRLAVIERDKLNGPAARVKRVYTVRVPDADPAPGTLPVLAKKLAVDVLPALRADHGWTQEKLEGFAVAGDGQAYAVTDNDGLDDATGETVFARLGRIS